MANQQLVDYINAQKGKGVSRDAINAALLGAGWSAADVSQAMDAAYGPAVSPTPTSSSVNLSGMGGSPAASSSPAATGGPSFFKPAPNAQPMGSTPGSSPFTAAASSSPVTFDPASVTVTEEHHVSKGLLGALAVVIILVIGALAYWMFSGGSSIPVPTPGEQDALAQLTQKNSELQSQVSQMTSQVADLENQLSIFAANTQKEVPLTIRGTLQQATSTKVFSITTNRNIIVSVSNSGDSRVVGALTPLVGTVVELQGTHPPVSAQLKVTHVNGTALAAPATPATTTTTTTATTSTP